MTIWTKLAAHASLETSRLLLRPFGYRDWEDFYAIVSNPENLSFLFSGSADKDEVQTLMVEKFMKAPLGKWALEDKGSGMMIGTVFLEQLKVQSRQAELAYVIRKDYWGQGFATEAVTAISSLSLCQLGLKEISIIAHLENKASQRVAEKSGFSLLRQYKGSDRYTHQMRQYRQYCRQATSLNIEKRN